MPTPMPTETLQARSAVYQALRPFEKGKLRRVHLEDVLDNAFREGHFSEADRRFATYLANGVLRDWFTLSARIEHLTKRPLARLDADVRLLIRLGLYQLLAMESVPDYAAVSTTMDLAATIKVPAHRRGVINGVLRRVTREGAGPDPALEATVPSWWLSRLKAQYDPQTVRAILSAGREIPRLTLRVNTLKTDVHAYKAALSAADIAYEVVADQPEVLHLMEAVGDPRGLPGFAEGHCVVQDAASAQVVPFLNPQSGERILDLGAAPGTKTSYMAALMENTGQIIAADISEPRLQKLAAGMNRLGVTIAETLLLDKDQNALAIDPVDRILLDAPCSGTGTLAKHPEILLVLQEEDFEDYAKAQLRLLRQAWAVLKQGGVLVYSTCSIDLSENDQVIKAFCTAQADCKPGESRTLLPTSQTHGFYMVRLEKLDSV